MHMEENLIVTWEAFDKPEKERKVDWFWALAIVGIAGSVLAFLFGNFLFGVFIVLATVIIMFFATQKPQKVSYKLDEQGLHMAHELIPYSKMMSFWLDERGEWGKILIHTTHPISPVVSVFYEDKNLGDDIYEILIDKIEEKPLIEPVSQQIFEKLGL
jgi:hypothetical protein